MTTNFQNIKKLILGKNKKNTKFFGFLLFPHLLAVLSEGLCFSFILTALCVLYKEGSWETPTIFQYLNLDIWFASLNARFSFVLLVVLAVSLQIIRSSLIYLAEILLVSVGTQIQTQAQTQVYKQIFQMSFRSANQYKTGDLLEYTKIPTEIIHATGQINRSVSAGLSIVCLTTFLFILNPKMAAFSISISSIFFLFQKFTVSKISSISKSLNKTILEFTNHTAASIRALKLIHTYDRRQSVYEKIRKNLETIASKTKSVNLWHRLPIPLGEVIGVAIIGLLLVGAELVFNSQQNLHLPTLLTFISIFQRLNGRIQLFVFSAGELVQSWAKIHKLEEILKTENKEFCSDGGIPFFRFKDRIVFKQTSLKYNATEKKALKNIDIEIKKGTTVAFVGHSGAGKSTIIDLLCGLYEPTEGSIKVDGIKLQKINSSSWKKTLGVVSQNCVIVDESIANNIRFGMPGASQEKIIEAAQLSGADAFIEELPNKYNTILGEGAHCLSGGEKQKIAFARAIIRDPEILILDEPTSNLDSHSEKYIQKIIERFSHIKTIVLVAHRLSTVIKADRIYVLDKGSISQKGSHDELLSCNGLYTLLWQLQKEKSPKKSLPIKVKKTHENHL